MINTQVDILNLFLPVNAGTPMEGAVNAGKGSADLRIQDGDFLQFLLGSIQPDAKIVDKALLSDACISENGNNSEQVPAGVEELSKIEFSNVNMPEDPVFGAVNLITINNPVAIQSAVVQMNPDKSPEMLRSTNAVVNGESKTETPWDTRIVSRGWQIGQADDVLLSAENELPVTGKFTAGRIIDPSGVFAGQKPTIMPETQTDSKGHIVITEQHLSNDVTMTDDVMTSPDQRLNRLAETLGVRTAEITMAHPKTTTTMATDSAAVTEKTVEADMFGSTETAPKMVRPVVSFTADVPHKVDRPEAPEMADVSQKSVRPKTTVPTDASPKSTHSEKSILTENSQEVLRPGVSALTDAPQKMVMFETSHRDSLRNQSLGQDKSDSPRPTAAISHPVESKADDDTVVRPVNENSSLESPKGDAKENLETIVSMKSSSNTSAEISRPFVQASGPTEKSAPTPERAKTPTVRFVLPENVRESIVRPGNTITLRMEPEHLGSVRLTLTSHHDTLTGRVVVESAAAKLAVESNLNGLRNQLSDEGLHLEQFQVSVGGEQARQNYSGDGSQFDHAPATKMYSSGKTGIVAAMESSISTGRQGGYVNAGGVNWLA